MECGGYESGSLSAEIYSVLTRESGVRTSKAALAALFPGKTALGAILKRMVKRGILSETTQGYRLTQAPISPPLSARVPRPLPERLLRLLAAIIRRAHLLRQRGMVTGAAGLLREAAAKISPHQAAQDLEALADLFEHAPTLYPVLDLPQRAAA